MREKTQITKNTKKTKIATITKNIKHEKKTEPRMTAAKRKDTHINFRASPTEKKLVNDAAKAENLDTGTYVRRSVLKQAELDLSVRSNFVIPDDKMKEFLECLDRPVQKKPRLRKLLKEDSILD